MKIFIEKFHPRNKNSSKDSRFEKQEIDSINPSSDFPLLAIFFQHDEHGPKGIFQDKEGCKN